MKSSCISVGLALAATLALSSSAASAASGELRALSETEMSDVYGRGLDVPTLSAFGALTTQEQSSSAVSAQASGDVVAALGTLSGDGLQSIDRQMAQQRLQVAATGVQSTLKIAQTMAALSAALAPIANNVSLPLLPFPLLFALPSLPSLAAIQNKH
jgi:hypothetical protein